MSEGVAIAFEHDWLVGQFGFEFESVCFQMRAIGLAGFLHHRSQIEISEVIVLIPPLHSSAIEHIVNQARQAGGLGGDNLEEMALPARVRRFVFGQQFGKHADRGERRLQFVRDVADEIRLLAGQSQLTFHVGHHQCAAGSNRQHQQPDQQRQRQMEDAGGAGQPSGILQIHCHRPMGQSLADLPSYERALRGAQMSGDRFATIVQQRHRDLSL